jgi:hypothetical protein
MTPLRLRGTKRAVPRFAVGSCRFVAAAVVFLLAVGGTLQTQAQTRDRARVAATVDSLAADALAGGQAAGLTVAVVRGSHTLVLNGYGKADLELDVPTPDRAVSQLGSATTQFALSLPVLPNATAAAGTGPAGINSLRPRSTRRFRPSSPCAPSSTMSPGCANTTIDGADRPPAWSIAKPTRRSRIRPSAVSK